VRDPELMILPSDRDELSVFVPGEGFEIVEFPLITAINFRRRKRAFNPRRSSR